MRVVQQPRYGVVGVLSPCWGLYNCLDRYSKYLRTFECDVDRTKNSSKLKELGSSFCRDFPCLFTRHNFANRLRDKINEAVYCNRILRGFPEMPSGELVGTTLKLTTGREVTDGHSHFPTPPPSPSSLSPPYRCWCHHLLCRHVFVVIFFPLMSPS